jgi:hypothetical protein
MHLNGDGKNLMEIKKLYFISLIFLLARLCIFYITGLSSLAVENS